MPSDQPAAACYSPANRSESAYDEAQTTSCRLAVPLKEMRISAGRRVSLAIKHSIHIAVLVVMMTCLPVRVYLFDLQ
jgi:hypothetical protein